MPRSPRNAPGGYVYHVLNRANARMEIFHKSGDYLAFEEILVQANKRVKMRLLAYCIMPTHWHLVLWPRQDGDVSEYMRWLTLTHTQRWHTAHDTVGCGHLYQGRFKSFPIQSDNHYLTVCRYVEQNPLKAHLVRRAQNWRWSSLYHRINKDAPSESIVVKGPVDLPTNTKWLNLVNNLLETNDQDSLQISINRNRPFGQQNWVTRTAKKLDLESTLRSRGRPKLDKKST